VGRPDGGRLCTLRTGPPRPRREECHDDLAVSRPGRSGQDVPDGGGGAWLPAPEVADAGFPSGGQGNVTILSATQGWICAYGLGLWHTTDGTHWSPLGVP
jgi:hypothetical protein